MKQQIDLNCDLGEGYEDSAIMPYISSCNIACGGHTGDNESVKRAINLAIENEVAIGAHPSYPDEENFGRASIEIDAEELLSSLHEQVRLVHNTCRSVGASMHHIKPHGALYNDLANDPALADKIIASLSREFPHAQLYLLAESKATEVALNLGVEVKHEVFADRVYQNKTSLRSRIHSDAVMSDAKSILNQISHLLSNKVIDHSGNLHIIQANSLCLHSDTPHAIELAQEISAYIKSKHVHITAD